MKESNASYSCPAVPYGHKPVVLALEQFSPYSGNLEEQLEIASFLRRVQDPRSRIVSAGMYRELSRAYNSDISPQFEEQAQEGFKSLFMNYSNPDHESPLWLVAAKHSAYNYIYTWHAYSEEGFSELPPKNVLEQTYETLFNFASCAVDLLTSKYEAKGFQREYIARQVGELSEISILLLLQRFALQNIVDGSFWPYPAEVTEDMQHNPRDRLSYNWDISVYEQLGSENPVDLSYMLQVKTNRRKLSKVPYDTEVITLVHLSDIVYGQQCSLDIEKHPISVTVPRLLALEGQDNEEATRMLNSMTAKLLDVMD